MKRIAIPALFLLLLAACQGSEQQKDDQKELLSTDVVKNPSTAGGTDVRTLDSMATMDFADSVHNFGNIREGEVVVYDFSFTNNGRTPLIIASATGSCGCTVPSFPREPVAPGQNGTIKVEFKSEGKPGHQEKTVTVRSNAKRGVNILSITVEVEPAK